MTVQSTCIPVLATCVCTRACVCACVPSQGFNSMPGQCKTALMDIRLYLETPGFRPPEDMSRLEGEPHSRKVRSTQSMWGSGALCLVRILASEFFGLLSARTVPPNYSRCLSGETARLAHLA